MKGAKNEKNESVLLSDIMAEITYANGDFIGDNSEPLLCGLEYGAALTLGYQC